MPAPIAVSESLFIAAAPEVVWDFTQDYGRRTLWDDSVLEAQVLDGTPRRVRVRLKGGVTCVFLYKLDERPRRTSLTMVEVESSLVSGGGGSWTYEASEGGTLWTVHNSIVLKKGLVNAALGPLIGAQLRSGTKQAMANAKRMIEAAARSAGEAPR